MKILLSLCARGGSKGILRKNIKEINGKALLAYSYETALKFKTEFLGDVTIQLSTDCLEIKKVALSLGLETDYSRPDYLANDKAGKLDVFVDLLNYTELKEGVRYDYYLDLDVSSPLRNVEDLIEAFKIINNNDDALNLFSVNNANKNPYFNMVEENESGFFELSKKLNRNVLSRQVAPKVFELNASFYFFKRAFFDLNHKSVISNKSLIYKMQHICFDLDHQLDFDFLNFLITHDKLDFKL